MPAKMKKLLAWSEEADRLLAEARAAMPPREDEREHSDAAVVRWALAEATKRRKRRDA
jgi:hypothetical protein